MFNIQSSIYMQLSARNPCW